LAARLAGLDEFEDAVKRGDRSLNFFQYHLHFRDVFEERGGFDLVIGNPPYVGQKGNKEKFKEIKENSELEKFYIRNMDFYYFFFHLSLNLIREKGFSTFITTNYFLTADGGIKLREDLKKRSILLKLINFNELSIFESAKGQHNIITIFQKGIDHSKEAKIIYTLRNENLNDDLLNKILSGFDEKTRYFKQSNKNLYKTENSYLNIYQNSGQSRTIQNILEDISSFAQFKLGEICYVNQGILSGIDKITNKHIQRGMIHENLKGRGVFVLSIDEINQLNLLPNEYEIIKPFYKNSDIKKYFCSTIPNQYLVYATRNINIDNYPNIKKHLHLFELPIKARSSDRGEIQAALKLGKWWVVFAARDKNIFESPKIVCPQRSKNNKFAYTDSQWYASGDVYFITSKSVNNDLKYILGLLNSKLYYWWFYYKGKRKGEYLELYYTPLTQVPIPKASEEEKQAIEKLVEKCLAAKGVGVEQWEAEIDERVAHLYGLTPADLKIIQGE
jgi:adenine-specific DNA-methyltransferase